MFFIQMSGFPGSGKSTLAQEIAKRIGAIIVDHDISKTTLLESTEQLEIDIELELTGKISYNIDWSLIEFYLSHNHNVIFDCPCLYEEMVQKGTNLALKYNVKYKYVECYLNDFDEINYRLRNRNRKISQIKEVKSIEDFRYTIENSKKPNNYKCLKVDTSKPLDSYIQEVLNYIEE
ncbi:AAA family ATPase [Ureibacillus acetophenoni]|uniref:Predicted kinase n=1 Tax=Ureibacillus acetophenoni TaxID=614649 RepID=A0A285UL67_9BACL|nr:AAA family ATPase [Ureibacillus acetophenoni]SOC42645.1 predicted kinase [Ureibacillus acetophenoni]